jgi:hypothetical protein
MSLPWTDHLLPLPKRFHVEREVTLEPGSIAVRRSGGDASPAREAEARLHALVGAPSDPPALTIDLVLDAEHADAGDLADLPNAAQAYRIDPTDEGLRVLALAPAGLLYGALTLEQLLRAGRRTDKQVVPLITVTDWPDIEQRGLWNFPDPADWIEWTAAIKLNYGKMADTRHDPVERGRPGVATIDRELLERGRQLAFAYVPYIVHLNFLHDTGLFRAYPELAGVGDGALAGRYVAHKQGNQHRAPCASQPVLVDLLTDWLVSIADQGADEISCWLSERPCQCACPRCASVGQFLQETRAFLAAWERAKQRHPDLRIRIFSSTTTPQQDDLVLAELPPEVRFERACAMTMDRVAHRPRDLFRNPLIDEAARAGRWVASYDVPLGAFGQVDTPEVKLPQYSGQRIRDFVTQLHERGYAGAYGMLAWATQAREICGFAIHALAEYAWNGAGRDVRDVAVAWATLEGLPDPAAVGTWAQYLGEVEFDLYDADFPMAFTWGHAAELVEQRRAPQLGEGLFRHAASEADLDRAIAAADTALGHVAGLEPALLEHATRVVLGLARLRRSVWYVAHRHAHGDLRDLDVQSELRQRVDDLQDAGDTTVDAIRTWRGHLGPEPWHPRVHDAIAGVQRTVERIRAHVHHRVLY